MENYNDRDFKGVWIPKEIYLMEISPIKKILLAEIDSLDHGEGCFKGNDKLANFVGVSEQRLADILTELRKDGLIIDRGFDGRKRFISVARMQGSEKQEPSVLKNKNQNQALSNTYSNNKKEEFPKKESFDITLCTDEELVEFSKNPISPYYKISLNEQKNRKRQSKNSFSSIRRPQYTPKVYAPKVYPQYPQKPDKGTLLHEYETKRSAFYDAVQRGDSNQGELADELEKLEKVLGI